MVTALTSLIITLVVIVPHPDDEVTLLDDIREAGPGALVVVLTDGAATGHCRKVADCVEARAYSTRGFLNEQAPYAKVVFVGLPDGKLDDRLVAQIAADYHELFPDARLVAAGADYGHRDHDATRSGVAAVGGELYEWVLRDDPQVVAAVSRWYGWLDGGNLVTLLGLEG